jgi:hypothetical protein
MNNQDPQSEPARLRAYYAELSEEELIEIGSHYDSLTDEAQFAIRAEFDHRGMPAPELAEEDETPEFEPLVTIRQYRDPADAAIAKSALDSAGIFAFLQNENTVRMDWLWSNLMGGLRLQVRAGDAAAAEELLSQPIPSVVETDDIKYEQPRCPNCQSLDISFESLNTKVGLASIILAVPIPWPKRLWTCNACGRKWKEVADSNTPNP